MKPYEVITNRFIELLESGVAPWKRPWFSNARGLAKNVISKKEYTGVNFISVNWQDYKSEFWGTYKQLQGLGGQVKKGEKGTPIIFFTTFEKEIEGKTEAELIPYAKLSYVFNLEQTEGIEIEGDKERPNFEHNPIEACEKLISGFPLGFCEVRHEKERAFYNPSLDYINLPEKSLFEKIELYYNTFFHEAVHATGHKSRLDRKGVAEMSYFGDAVYSKEELIAELGASFLCAHCKIDNVTVNDSASYLAGWLKMLRQDAKFLIQASGQAQKAANYLKGV